MKRIISHLLLITMLGTVLMLPAIACAQAAPVAGSSSTGGVIATAAGWLTGAIPTMKILDAVLEFAILPVASWMLALSGYMLDFSINFSLNFATQVSAAGSSIVLGWTIMRDLFNMFFIFALIFIAIETMLGISGFASKTTLKNIIIGALLINFSFFFTTVLIDAGNVVGGWLYNGIETTLASSGATSPTGSPSISAGLSGALGVYDVYNVNKTGGLLGGLTLNDVTSELISAFIRFAIIIFATYIFAYVTVLFFARTVSLLFMLVMSPIGFAGWILPMTKPMADEWKEEMEKNILLAPVFLLYLYVIIAFVSSSLFNPPNLLGAAAPNALDPSAYFKYFLLAAMLLYALNKAKKFSGQLGDMVSKITKEIVGGISGVALGAATGGVSTALQATVGRAGSALAGSSTVKNLVGGESRVGRLVGGGLKNIGTSASKQTFDASKKATEAFKGMDASVTIPKFMQASTKKGETGYAGARKATEREAVEIADYLAATKEENAMVNNAKAQKRLVAEQEVGQTIVNKRTEITRAADQKIQDKNIEIDAARATGNPLIANQLATDLEALEAKKALDLKTADNARDAMVEQKLSELMTEEAKRDSALAAALKATSRVENYAKAAEGGSVANAAVAAGVTVASTISAPISGLLGRIPVVGKAFAPSDPIAIKRFLEQKISAEDKKLAEKIRDSQKEENKKKRKEEELSHNALKKAVGEVTEKSEAPKPTPEKAEN